MFPKAGSKNRGFGLGAGTRGDFTTMAESKVNIALALGLERRLTVLFVDEPPGWNGMKPTGCVDYTRDAASWWMRRGS